MKIEYETLPASDDNMVLLSENKLLNLIDRLEAAEATIKAISELPAQWEESAKWGNDVWNFAADDLKKLLKEK